MRGGWIGLVVGTLLIAGCGQAGRLASAPEVRVQARALQNVTVEEARAVLLADPAVIVLDVRQDAEYQAGHIEKSLLRPVSQVANWSKTLDKDARYLLVCRSGNRSALAGAKLVDYGFSHVASVTGGMTAWTAAGYPVVTARR